MTTPNDVEICRLYEIAEATDVEIAAGDTMFMTRDLRVRTMTVIGDGLATIDPNGYRLSWERLVGSLKVIGVGTLSGKHFAAVEVR